MRRKNYRGLMMKKILATTLLLATLPLAIQNVMAETKTTETKDSAASQDVTADASVNQTKTWLGVSLTPVPPVLANHLGKLLPENQGVMIQAVVPDSPAAQAGLEPFDIILSFNDQQLYSAKQLAGLVAASKPDDEVTLNIVRNGSKQTVKVKLGSHKIAPQAPVFPRQRQPMLGMNQHPVMPQGMIPPNFWKRPFTAPQFNQPVVPPQGKIIKPLGQTNVMQQFESIRIHSLDGKRYHAEVEYQENGGEKKKFVFEGTYDEIRKQIQENKELPDSKKNSLLNALKTNPDQLLPDMFMNFPQMPVLPAMPTFDHFFDNQPSWFRNGSKL